MLGGDASLGDMANLKRKIRLEIAVLAVAIYFAAILNLPFWRAVRRAVDPHSLYDVMFLAAVAVAVVAVFNLVLTILGTRHTFKPLVMLLLPVTAAASYFMWEYGIVIDVHMIRNVFETDPREAGDLTTLHMIVAVLLGGVLPTVAVWFWPIDYRPFWSEVKYKTGVGVVSAVLAALAVVPFMGAATSVFREHTELRLTLTPSNYLAALQRYAAKHRITERAIAAPVGEDAKLGNLFARDKTKSLTVLVIGETARAANFSLNGYDRQTNPRLSAVPDLLYFSSVRSCGTDTAQSVPCMFSTVGRKGFSSDIARRQEGLLDILKRVGFDVLWRENQSGCKGVCERVRVEVLTESKTPTFYDNGESHDEVLLSGLPETIAGLQGHAVIVMHMMGSHGPAYFKRYPRKFETFTPACKSTNVSRCTSDELRNAYDNTITYTDHVLAELIDILRRGDAQGVPTSMIFVSDHGESLGENNIYLHGMPYAIAPDYQTHVPMLAWFSPAFRSATGLDAACAGNQTALKLSHDNLSHTLLGMLGVETKVYDPALDIFAACRPRPARSEPPRAGIQAAPQL